MNIKAVTVITKRDAHEDFLGCDRGTTRGLSHTRRRRCARPSLLPSTTKLSVLAPLMLFAPLPDQGLSFYLLTTMLGAISSSKSGLHICSQSHQYC